MRLVFLHLGLISLTVGGTTVLNMLESSDPKCLDFELLDVLALDTLLLYSWMNPGAVSSVSLIRIGLDSMVTTCSIDGRRAAAACMQKRATLMYRMTSSGYSPRVGSISSLSFLASYSSHVCCECLELDLDGGRYVLVIIFTAKQFTTSATFCHELLL